MNHRIYSLNKNTIIARPQKNYSLVHVHYPTEITMKDAVYMGLACTPHDGAIAVFRDGKITFAEATERPFQSKFAVNITPDHRFYCDDLFKNGILDGPLVVAKTWSDDAERIWIEQSNVLDQLAQNSPHRDLFLRMRDRYRSAWLDFVGASVKSAGYGIRQSAGLARVPIVAELAFDHHLCHAANGAYTSPFEDAAVAVLDASGEGDALAFWTLERGELVPVEREPYTGIAIETCASLGAYFGVFTALACGYPPMAGDEWKIMGLASYGRLDPALLGKLRSMYRIDGLTVNCTEDAPAVFVEMVSAPKHFAADFQAAADRAFTFQAYFCEMMTTLLTELRKRTGKRNLVLSGGCALNSSYNGRLLAETGFSALHVPSAPGDDGNAIGAAVLAARKLEGYAFKPQRAQTPYLGSEMSERAVSQLVRSQLFDHYESRDEDELCRRVATLLADGDVVAWTQGKAEFGPRALGNRSILASAADPGMKDKLNRIVKFREGFRPFAPSIPEEFADRYFVGGQQSPYMERTLEIREERRAEIPAACHADNTGRLQTVSRELNPRFHKLLNCYGDLTGVPVLINTSLNVMGKPIVHSVEDVASILTFSDIDHAVVNNFIFSKRRAKAGDTLNARDLSLVGAE